MTHRPFVLIAAIATLTLAGPTLAQTRPLSVEIDHSTRIQLRGAAGSVIVGNPAIADVTVVDSNTLYITGRGYGSTEVIAVDAIGRTVYQGQVLVTGASAGTVRVWRGAQATEMVCAETCSASIRSVGGEGGSAGGSAGGAISAPAGAPTPSPAI